MSCRDRPVAYWVSIVVSVMDVSMKRTDKKINHKDNKHVFALSVTTQRGTQPVSSGMQSSLQPGFVTVPGAALRCNTARLGTIFSASVSVGSPRPSTISE
jgi:hypothetical protein